MSIAVPQHRVAIHTADELFAIQCPAQCGTALEADSTAIISALRRTAVSAEHSPQRMDMDMIWHSRVDTHCGE